MAPTTIVSASAAKADGFLEIGEGVDGGRAEKKNGVGFGDRFPAGGVHLVGVGGAIGDDFGNFRAKSLQARKRVRWRRDRCAEEDAFAAQLECEFVDQSLRRFRPGRRE